MKKTIGIVLIILGLLIGAGIFYFLFLNKPLPDIKSRMPFGSGKSQTDNAGNNIAATTTAGGIKKISIEEANKTENQPESPPKRSQQFSKEDLKRIASSFAERFGSYSNQSNFSNVYDLKIFMTRNMSRWATNFINEHTTDEASAIYYSISTVAVSEEIKEFDDDLGKAIVLVKTRRREANGTTNNLSDIFSQDIVIVFLKENGLWKVDSASWVK